MINFDETLDNEHVNAERVDARKKKDDVTGQTDTTLKEMKARLKEVPHRSAGSTHDKEQYAKAHHPKRKKGAHK